MNDNITKLVSKSRLKFSTGVVLLGIIALFLTSCTLKNKPMQTTQFKVINHSFGNQNDISIEHIHLNLAVNFKKKELIGYAKIKFSNLTNTNEIILDHKDMVIEKVTTVQNENLDFYVGEENPDLGSPLAIKLKKGINEIMVYYKTTSNSQAIQWLSPEQTSGKKAPFLFTQSQAILARTWVPLMDAPSVRFTYSATITCPKDLMALMSASNPTEKADDGVYSFTMPQPIPSYLMALAVGDFQYHKLGDNCGVYAEKEMMDKSIYEFSDLDLMIKSAESLYGKYAWGKYDLLVLPASFPFGGMENPRLTFVTPTIITCDKSLVALIAHELAHSWSGNLVTNETWNDFWLNEGFTVYFEQRIMEKLYGVEYANMETENGYKELLEEIEAISKENPDDTKLKLELDGRNPDEGMTSIAYEKGRFLLTLIEHTVGREKWDNFLKQYFKDHSFKTMNTTKFIEYINTNLLQENPEWAKTINLNKWIYEPGLPSNCPIVSSTLLDSVRTEIAVFEKGKDVSKINAAKWTTHQWLYFFRNCDKTVIQENMVELDTRFQFTKSTNSEILCDWFKHGIECNYKENNFDSRLEAFLIKVGRRKFLEPLYLRLAIHNKEWARQVFAKAKSGYHSVSSNTVEEILK